MYKVYAHLDKVGDFMVDEDLEWHDFSYPYECIWGLDLDKIIEMVKLDSNEYNYYVTIYDAKDEKVAEGRGKDLCKIK